MITLGGVTLNGSLQWTDRFGYSPIVTNTNRTLAGSLVVFSASMANGRPITLEATEDTGWFTKQMVDDILVLAYQIDTQFLFDFHAEETHNVMFDHSEQAVDFTPLIPKVPFDQNESYFTGRIVLFTV